MLKFLLKIGPETVITLVGVSLANVPIGGFFMAGTFPHIPFWQAYWTTWPYVLWIVSMGWAIELTVRFMGRRKKLLEEIEQREYNERLQKQREAAEVDRLLAAEDPYRKLESRRPLSINSTPEEVALYLKNKTLGGMLE
jgi:hypothetical protein